MHQSKTLLVLVSILLHHTILAQSYGELQVSNFLDANYHQSLACYDSLLKKKFVPLENHKIALAAINQLESNDEYLVSGFGFTKQEVIANIDRLENGTYGNQDESLPQIHTGEIFKQSKVNCSGPFDFSQDCSGKFPTGKTSLLDKKFRIAGSEDGREIWIKVPKENNFGDQLLSILESDPYSTNSPYLNTFGIGATPQSKENLSSQSIFTFRSIFDLLAKNGINILRLHTILDRPGSSRAVTVGFIMELDGNGYSILKDK